MFNVPMMAITEEGEAESTTISPGSVSPKNTLSVPSCLDNHVLPRPDVDNNCNHENGGALEQFQIKTLRRELPRIPQTGKKNCNFLTVDDPLDVNNNYSTA